MYDLIGVVVHCGRYMMSVTVYCSMLPCIVVYSGPNRGHYITIVKSHGFWLLFDDDIMEV